MQRLWAPWRMQYVSAADNGQTCVFCDHLQAGDDVGAHILHRAERTFVIMNAFPYNTGHVMIAPVRHVGELSDTTSEERAEMMEVTHLSTEVIGRALAPHGFNIGMNLGTVAGAGIPGHLHVHVVPRWGGDTNFMTTVGETKVLPEDLTDTDAKLRPLFAELASGGAR